MPSFVDVGPALSESYGFENVDTMARGYAYAKIEYVNVRTVTYVSFEK